MKTYRVGIAMMVHDHVWGELKHWAALENAEIVAACDPNEELREKITSDHGVEKTYDCCAAMLDGEELDIIQIASENANSADIVEAAAPRGIHIVCEKPMAARLSQADRMLAAAREADVKMLINWPNAWSPAFQTLDRLVTEGAVGDVFSVRYRAAHNGPMEIGCSEYFWKWLYDEELNGAGALMDYCCYGASMSATWLGVPEACVGVRSTLVKDYPIPDDNAMIIAKYSHAYAACEASWTQRVGTPGPNPLVYGSEGALGIEAGALKMWRPGASAKALEPEVVALDEPPVGRRNGPEHIIWCIENDQEAWGVCNAQHSRNAQEILEAGLISADTGIEVKVPVE